MISERITITTDPITIQQLIATARSVAAADIDQIPKKCTGIMLKYVLISDTKVVTLADPAENHGGGSAQGVSVLDRTNGLISSSFSQFGIDKALLSVPATTLDVDIVITQSL